MAKRKSDYAIIISCNPGYGFGMLSTMNAQAFFKTDADWEIAYEDYTDEQRNAISGAFDFNVNWTHISELMTTVVDRRTDKRADLNRFWLAYWLLAFKVLKEKKYKAVCVIQADQFVFVNLDVYFKMAAQGIIVSTEYAFSTINAEDLPFGDDKAIWNRCMCGVFDGVNFLGQEHVDIPKDTIEFQCEDPFKDEANHSVIALNRAVAKHGKKDSILRLDRHIWMGDATWHLGKFSHHNNRVYNDRQIQICGWHCRWWQPGRANGEAQYYKNADKTDDLMRKIDILEHNYNFINNFMKQFNEMRPPVKSDYYEKGIIKIL